VLALYNIGQIDEAIKADAGDVEKTKEAIKQIKGLR